MKGIIGGASTTVVLEHFARPVNRSPLFWWLLEHHDEVVAAAAGRRIQWKQFCADAAVIGLTDTTGKTPRERNARETWRQVRKEKLRLEQNRIARETAAAAAAEKRRSYPSRMPRDWRPLRAEPAVPAVSAARAPAPSTESEEFKPWEDPSLTPEQAAHVKEQYEKMDRRDKWVTRSERRLSDEEYHALSMEFDLGYRKAHLAKQEKEGK
jgi:hypothetical protein